MYKKKQDEIPTKDDIGIKEAVEKWIETYRLRSKYDESSIVNAWPNIIGKAIANRTQQIYIRDKKLFVKVESAVNGRLARCATAPRRWAGPGGPGPPAGGR